MKRLRKYAAIEGIDALLKRFAGRTREAVKAKRSSVLARQRFIPWTTSDIALLKKMWKVSDKQALCNAFRNRSWSAIKGQAATLNLYVEREQISMGNEYVDQIRLRAKEDRISLYELAAQTGISVFFLREKRLGRVVDLNKVAKLVEFFGGKLVIDWQDE